MFRCAVLTLAVDLPASEKIDAVLWFSFMRHFYLLPTPGTTIGEELLIDYGSAKKGLYRFVRTYGFVNQAPVHGTPSSPPSYGLHEDILRVHVRLPEAGGLYDVEPEPPAASEASETGHVQGRRMPGQRMQGATETACSRSCAAEDPSPCSDDLSSRQEFTVKLPVDVGKIDTMIAEHSSRLATDAPEESVPESGGKELRDGGGAPWVPAADQAVGALPSSRPAKRALHVVLEKRLSAYSTSLPEDIAFAARRRKQSEISGDPHVEWEILCARIRGAEKAALISAMLECCTTGPGDGTT